MPFGLINAPATFQRVLDDIFRDLPPPELIRYFDDLLLLGNTEEDLHMVEEKVFSKCEDYSLTINRRKTKLNIDEVEFLGYLIKEGEIRPPKDKIIQIIDIPLPTNLEEVRRFLGVVGYYRPMIPQLSLLEEPLHHLTRKNVKFALSDEHKEAIQQIKQSLQEATVSTILPIEDGWKFVLLSDASNIGVGATLEQRNELNNKRIVGYFSKKWNSAQQNYSTSEQEFFAIILALEHFDYFLRGRETIVVTDHQPLVSMMMSKNPKGRLSRWIWRLLEYNITIQYLPGDQNVIADYLSRIEGEEKEQILNFEEVNWKKIGM